MFVGWRPAFKYYNKWVALFGAAVCVAIMFVIRWYYALVTFIIVLILYKIVDFLKPGKLNYRIVGKVGRDLNLAAWRSAF